jgi:hypothetical protein
MTNRRMNIVAMVFALVFAKGAASVSEQPGRTVGQYTDAEVTQTESRQPKPILIGLIDMQTIAWHNQDDGEPTFSIENVAHFPGLFGGIVVNATWKEMQPEPRGHVDFSRIDAALAQVRRYNVANAAAPLGVNIRIFAGNQAPGWAKQIDGGPVTIFRNPQGCHTGPCPTTIGKVWNPEYIAAWRAFQQQVAAQYDAEPLIRAVSITSCATQTDEPFVPSIDPQARANLVAAGYTDAAGEACLIGAIEDYSAWKRTPIHFPINSFNRITHEAGGRGRGRGNRGGNRGGGDSDFAEAVMRACRKALGERCVLANHGLGAEMPEQIASIVQEISDIGGPIHYQTESPPRMGGWQTVIAAGIRYHASAIELWPDAKFQGFTTLSVEAVTALRDQLANASPPRH